jgi:hypothetical protein
LEHRKTVRKSQTRDAVESFRTTYEPLNAWRETVYRVADKIQKYLAKIDPRAVPRRPALVAAVRAGTDPTYLEPGAIMCHALVETDIHVYGAVEFVRAIGEFAEIGQPRYGWLSVGQLPIAPLRPRPGQRLGILEAIEGSPIYALFLQILAEARSAGWDGRTVVQFNRLPNPPKVRLDGAMLFSLRYLPRDIVLGAHLEGVGPRVDYTVAHNSGDKSGGEGGAE